MKKIMHRVLQVFLIASLILTSFTVKQQNGVEAKETSDILDSLEIIRHDETTGYYDGQTISVRGKWSLPNDTSEKTYKAGDSFSIQIPDALEGLISNLPLKDENGRVLAVGSLEGNKMTFTFTEEIEQKTDRHGEFVLGFRLNYDSQGEDEDLELTFTDENGYEISKETITVIGTNNDVIEGETDEKFHKGPYAWDYTDEIKWFIRVNRAGTYKDEVIRITDRMQENHELVPGSIKISRSQQFAVTNPSDVTLMTEDELKESVDIKVHQDLKGFDISFKDNDKYWYTIDYKTRYTGEDFSGSVTLKNDAYAIGSNTGKIKFDGDKGDHTAKITIDLGGWASAANPGRVDFKINKVESGSNKNLQGVEFKLEHQMYKDEVYVQTTNEQGIAEFKNVVEGFYKLTETKPLDGYEPINSEYIYISQKTEDGEYRDSLEYTIENELAPIDIKVEKKWQDENGFDLEQTPNKNIVFQLYANNNLSRQAVLKAGETELVFKNLPILDENGHKINYEVKEVSIDGFESHRNKVSDTNYVFTNQIKTRDIEVEKEWLSADGEAMEPIEDIKVSLYKTIQGKKELVETKEITVKDQKITFENLPVIDNDGNEIIYSVEEEHSGDYEVNIKGQFTDEVTIENKVKVNTIELEVNKKWISADENNPKEITPQSDIEIELLRNGESTGETKTLKKGEKSVVFKNLKDKDINGNPYKYTVRELEVENFDPSYDYSKENEVTITNKYVVPTTEIEVTKVWKNLKGKTIESHADIEILLKNKNTGSIVDRGTLPQGEEKLTFENIPVTDEEGNKIEYDLEELDVNGFTSEIEFIDEDYQKGYTATITNTTDVEMTDIKGHKVWFDVSGKKLDASEEKTITIDLYKDGVYEDSVTLEKGEYDFAFTNLPKTDKKGNEFKYTVKERDLEGFKSHVTYNEEEDLFIISNKKDVEYFDLSGTKSWIGLDGEKMESASDITIELHADGKLKDSIVLSEGEYDFTFKNLPRTTEEGKKITYEVKELEVDGFTSDIDMKGDHVSITNTQKMEKVDIKGHKVWFDVSGKQLDKAEEQTIIIDLLRDGEVIDSVTLEKGEYDFAFTDLDKTDVEGNEFDYTVEERDLDGFTAHVSYDEEEDLFIISNKKDVEYFDLHGSKTWLGLDGEVMDSAAEITVELYANGELKETIVLAKGEYDFVFENLPLTDEKGQAIKYVVKELPLEGFQSKVEYKDGKIFITNMEDVEEVDSVNVEPKDPEEVEEVLEVQVLPQTGQGVSGLVYTGLAGFILGLFLFLKDRKED